MTTAEPSRRTFALALCAWTFLAVYGSLVPFWFEPVALPEAMARFRSIRFLPLGVASRSDFVANVLLFVPLGLLAMGTLRVDRPARSGAGLVAGLLVMLAATGLAAVLEFAQISFPPRTVSLNDIVAESAGAAIGVVLWWLCGQTTVDWARRTFGPSAETSRLRGWLTVYAVGFMIWQLMPFDVTLRPAELALKAREGRVTLVPFAEFRTDVVKATWNLVVDAVLWLPIGALVVTHERGRRRSWPMLALVGAACGAALEVLQVFVFTRFTDATDVVAAAAGVAGGAWLAVRRAGGSPVLVRRDAWLLVATLWVIPLLWYHWFPFDFDVSRAQLARHARLIFTIPFASYYWSPEFAALSTLLRKAALAAPLGFALGAARAGRPGGARSWWGAGAAVVGALVLSGIEVGQLFLPGRFGDVTDVLIGLAGMWAGWRASRVFARVESVG